MARPGRRLAGANARASTVACRPQRKWSVSIQKVFDTPKAEAAQADESEDAGRPGTQIAPEAELVDARDRILRRARSVMSTVGREAAEPQASLHTPLTHTTRPAFDAVSTRAGQVVLPPVRASPKGAV